MIFLSPKKPPFEKTTSSNESWKFENFQLYIKMTFLWSKKSPFAKTTSSNDK